MGSSADASSPAPPSKRARRLPRNDPRQYDELAETWWDERGPLAMLQWIARARARLIPPAMRPDAVLIDVACGGGLLAPVAAEKGYRHFGVDLSSASLRRAGEHGVHVTRADVACLPFPSAVADVVCAGEILEHVRDHCSVIGEAARVLRPGGVLVIDTIADTRLARFLAVSLAERIPGGAPPGIHDPALFVDRRQLVNCCAAAGVELQLSGLRPATLEAVAFLARRRRAVRMIPTRSTAVLFQGVGVKAS